MDSQINDELALRSKDAIELLKNIKPEDKGMQEMYLYAVRGGRRLRTSLVSVGCEAVGGDNADVIPAAAAIELMHKFTLVHDDLIDREDHRRGRRTFHEVFGSKNSIIMGDFLISMSFNVLKRLLQNHDTKKTLRCYSLLSSTLDSLCTGEIKDCIFESRESVTMPNYLSMIEEKTASLMRSALVMGAVLGDADETQIKLLSDYGTYFGLEFQIQNDINNLLKIEEDAGRKRGFDIHKKKKTPMVIKTLETGSEKEKELLLQTFSKKEYSKTDIDAVIEVFKENSSLDYAKSLVAQYAAKARESISSLDETDAKRFLLHLADHIEEETYWKPNSANGV